MDQQDFRFNAEARTTGHVQALLTTMAIGLACFAWGATQSEPSGAVPVVQGAAVTGAVAKPFLEILGAGGMVTGASFAVGALIGFIFGIPRTLQDASLPQGRYAGNTNLEQISDWLSKIIVGATLVELNSLAASLNVMASQIGPALGGGPSGKPIALSLLVAGAFCGFFYSYIRTRLYLPVALTQADGITNKALKQLNEAELSNESKRAPPVLLGTAQQAAGELRSRSIDSLVSVDELRAWARVKLADGAYALATQALDRAVKAEPANPTVRREHAVALSATNDHEAAISELEVAARLTAGNPVTERLVHRDERRLIVEGQIFNLLYLPNAYQRAIEAGEAYLNQKGVKDSPAIRAYLAAAYGQKYRAQAAAGAEPPVQTPVRNAALAAATQALALDTTGQWKSLLRLLWNPNHPDKVKDPSAQGEDDLEVFFGDPDFEVLLK